MSEWSVLKYRRYIFPPIILILVLTVGGCTLDLGCIGSNVNPYSHEKFKSVISEDQNQDGFYSIYSFEYSYDVNSGYGLKHKLQQGHRFTADRAGLVAEKSSNFILRYGPQMQRIDTGWDYETLSKYSYSTSSVKEADYLPITNQRVIGERWSAELPSTYFDTIFTKSRLIQGSLLTRGKFITDKSRQRDTLIKYKPLFYDSTKYRVNDIHAPRFNVNADPIFISRRRHVLITQDSLEEDFFHNIIYEESWVLRYNIGNASIDSLFQLPTTKLPSRFIPGEKNLLYVTDENLFLLTRDGNIEFEIKGDGFEEALINPKGTALAYAGGNRYYRTTDNKKVDLGSLFDGKITISQPYEEEVLVNVGDTSIYQFNINKSRIENRVGIHQMPRNSDNPAKRSTYTLHAPVLREDGTMQVLFIDKYHFDDPNDPCD